jgi:hypothetical protein
MIGSSTSLIKGEPCHDMKGKPAKINKNRRFAGMNSAMNYKEIIVKDLEELSPELIQEVIDFVEFLKYKRTKQIGIDYNSLQLQQQNLGKIWDMESENLYKL